MHDGRIDMARKDTKNERVEISRKHLESLVSLVPRNLVLSRLQIYVVVDPWVHSPQLNEGPESAWAEQRVLLCQGVHHPHVGAVAAFA
jgi:hypothetical protein